MVAPADDLTGRICALCSEEVKEGETATLIVVMKPDSTRQEAVHPECQALGIIGHDFGVCTCTGFQHDRAAALELRRRLIEKRIR